MKPTNLNRNGFTLNGRHHTYGDLRRYVCNECGGGVVHKAAWNEAEDRSEDKVACARCGCEDIISESKYLEQIADGWEAERGLPEPLRKLLRGESECQSATDAADALSV